MIDIKSYNNVRYGYYLIKPMRKEDDLSSGFSMPDDESKLAYGEIVESGEYFYSNGESINLDFEVGDMVVFRDSGNIKLSIMGSKHILVPHENVYISEEK